MALSMRILHVNKFFDFHGGAEVYLHELMDRQREAGHEVHVFATKKPGTPPHPDDRFSPDYHPYTHSEGVVQDVKKGLAFVWNRQARAAFSRMLDEVRPDVIHLHNIYHHLSTSILAEIRKRNLVCVQTLHDHKLACPNYKMFTQGSICERCKNGKYLQAVKYQCLSTSFVGNMLGAVEMHLTKLTSSYEKTVQAFLCPSRYLEQTMKEWGEPASKLVYLPNPTDMPKEQAPRGGGYVLYAGRLSPEKGVDTLIRAIATIHDLPLWIAGTGPEEARLKRLAEELGASHVRFLGFVAPVDLAKIRAASEATVLATRMRENASGAILESLAAGIPVLASKVGGNPELVQEERTGWLIPADDEDAWREALRRFKDASPERRTEMGVLARAFIRETRTWKQHLQALERLYTQSSVQKNTP